MRFKDGDRRQSVKVTVHVPEDRGRSETIISWWRFLCNDRRLTCSCNRVQPLSVEIVFLTAKNKANDVFVFVNAGKIYQIKCVVGFVHMVVSYFDFFPPT